MASIQYLAVTGAAIIAAAAAWHVESFAQENARSGAGVVTVFDHAKLDSSFAKALANGGTAPLWSRTSGYGTSDVSVHSRESNNSACPPQGCSHKGYTAVVIVVSGAATLEVGGTSKAAAAVIVVSGAATLEVGGTSKAAAADKFGGQLVQGGQSHRITQGNVFIMPPDTMHWYRDVATPFRYIEVPVP